MNLTDCTVFWTSDLDPLVCGRCAATLDSHGPRLGPAQAGALCPDCLRTEPRLIQELADIVSSIGLAALLCDADQLADLGTTITAATQAIVAEQQENPDR
ncbi:MULTISPECIES: hypothetical protein [unclassified Pseudonocardia]|uniref:hypothetical protein n=1 Tax=unclassified Pseudonocardia TaxID=2619320 RepID=UPI0001FFE2C6|nr:hypothetical protein [Pseudonocardia sp. Ae707_Ps1]OLM20855.1 hypothetical protein Ae707Ps1_5114 [Pseudonocardia sp. Ae707_Ps1]